MKFAQDFKKSRFPLSVFGVYFGVLLLMAGVHTALLVIIEKIHLHVVLQSIVPIVYWGMVAVGLTWFTRKKMEIAYEKPIIELDEAMEKVANGDFSIYVSPTHTVEKRDYLDSIILHFNNMVEDLGSIETLKTDFVSNVSHEMKTPIAIIKNYAELLQKDNLTEAERKEYALAIEEASVRLSDLIGNILKLNKLENQRTLLETEVYDVSRQLTECILHFEDAWDEKEIELEVDIEDYALIKADESLLTLVWNNLLSNAIKFTPSGGTIAVRQVSYEDRIEVIIADTGCGMSKESQKRIFDKFYQGDVSHSKEGNGLGLALVKRVLELLDAQINVVSEEGKGSTFTVVLPKAE